jgi:hypothetical protein
MQKSGYDGWQLPSGTGLLIGVAGVGPEPDGTPIGAMVAGATGVVVAGVAAAGDSGGGRVGVGTASTGRGVMVGMSGTGHVGVTVTTAVGSLVALGDGATMAVGVGPGGVSAVRKSAATHPSRPSASRTWRH